MPGATRSTPPSASENQTPMRRRPGGRTERIRRAVAGAVLELYRDGHIAFGVAEVAERSGVHRATVYRRWPTRALLLREALTLYTSHLTLPDSGSLRSDLQLMAEQLVVIFSDPLVMAMNGAIASGADPELAEVAVVHWTPVFDEMSRILERAIERGEAPSAVDPGILSYLLVSPLLVHTVLLHASPSPQFVAQLAYVVAASAPAGTSRSTTDRAPGTGDC
jgi:AcrR family transcriptional regulator